MGIIEVAVITENHYLIIGIKGDAVRNFCLIMRIKRDVVRILIKLFG